MQLDPLRAVLEPFLIIETLMIRDRSCFAVARVLKIHDGHHSLYRKLKFTGKTSDF